MPSATPKTPTIRQEVDLSSLDEQSAHDLLARLISVDPKNGILRLLDTRFTVLRPVVLVNIQKQLEQTIGASTKGFLYLAGEKSAESGFDAPAALAGKSKAEGLTLDSFKWLTDALALMGYGRLDVRLFDREEDRFVVTLANSPLAEAYGSSTKPVCHLIAGFLAGIGKRLLAQELLCEEIACSAQGKPQCEFELRSMSSL